MYNGQDLNIFVVGKPFSGANTVARIIYGNWRNFKYIDMNYLIDMIYNDFLMVNQHKGQMRRVIKSSVILKNAEFLYRSIGIPEYIASQKLLKLMEYVDNPSSTYRFKRAIWQVMSEFNPNWRTIFVKQRIIERPSNRYIFSHALTQEELNIVDNPVIVYVDTTDIANYQHSYNSSQIISQDDIFDKEYRRFCTFCKKNADFIIYNNDGIKELELQLEDLRKVMEIDRNDEKPIKWYRKSNGLQ